MRQRQQMEAIMKQGHCHFCKKNLVRDVDFHILYNKLHKITKIIIIDPIQQFMGLCHRFECNRNFWLLGAGPVIQQYKISSSDQSNKHKIYIFSLLALQMMFAH